MATSVVLAHSQTSGSATGRFLVIGNQTVNSGWSDSTVIYTVPTGKRLVLKTTGSFTPNASKRFLLAAPGASPVEKTYTFPEGIEITASGADVIVATGFLEDDI